MSKCRWCKGTKTITLLLSTVPCTECGGVDAIIHDVLSGPSDWIWVTDAEDGFPANGLTVEEYGEFYRLLRVRGNFSQEEARLVANDVGTGRDFRYVLQGMRKGEVPRAWYSRMKARVINIKEYAKKRGLPV